MKRISLLFIGCLTCVTAFSQTAARRIQQAYQQFESDEQLKHAISSLYVVDANTGEVVFEKNAKTGLVPASTQKVVTSVTAFELLGKDYRYKTFFKLMEGKLYVAGSGDPTFGSWRYPRTADTAVFDAVIDFYKAKGINSVSNLVMAAQEDAKTIPSGWIFEDIANYYGTSPKNLSWHENQFDITFIPGRKEGDPAIIDSAGVMGWRGFRNQCITGKPGSGDNAYVYFAPGERGAVIQGTVPAGVKRFQIAAADVDPASSFAEAFTTYAAARHYYGGGPGQQQVMPLLPDRRVAAAPDYVHYSPPLDSSVYWFLKKSINLYGEALIRTFASENQALGPADSGIARMKKFWKEKGLDPDELNISDGSGLSPLNRVTTHAQVVVLKYARSKTWFAYFYDALPEYNSMKMKSGTISDVKGFCGYQRSKDGREYIFSFLVNNYSGKTPAVVAKMYRVLDQLK
jgi:D-alanyl-D-alanine carboxypeptidase/D-alanyl-D-alanine-endopeptidase (penicillin-binding protein 4)